jgi:hypothetical protein
MNKINEWTNSSITLMGNPEVKRGTVSKLILMGLIGIIAAKAIIMPFQASADSSQPQMPSEFSQLKTLMDPAAKKINDIYGAKHTIFIYANDTNLKNVLEHTESRYLEDMPYGAGGGGIKTAAEKVQLHEGEYGKDEMLRQKAYDGVTSKSEGAHAWQNRRGNINGGQYKIPQAVVLLNDETPDYKDHPFNFPRVTTTEEQVYITFFHELTHGVDTEESSIPGIDEYSRMVLQESIGDAGSALISLSKTGNLDEYNFNRKPQRINSAVDNGHMTTEVVDRALADVTYDSVKNLSDREILLYAKDRVVQTAEAMMQRTNSAQGAHLTFKYAEWNLNQSKHALFMGEKNIGEDAMAKHQRWVDRFSSGHTEQVLRDFSREGMEASINNLAYQNKLGDNEAGFIRAALDHAEKHKDPEVKIALDNAMIDGHLDYQKFSQSMGFKVDFESHSRQEENIRIMSNYHKSIINPTYALGFDVSGLAVNLSTQAIGRYADKVMSDFRKVKESAFTME